jgi:hypothetical protein
MPRLFWSPNAGPAGQQSQALQPGQNLQGQQAVAVDPSDLVFPAPGGGLLRVPVGGGAAAQLSGTANGQLVFWDGNAGQWVVSGTPSDGQLPVWSAALNAYVMTTLPTPSQIAYFGLQGNPVGLWNFNNTLADASGNGLDLSAEVGAASFCDIVPGKAALYIGQGQRFGRAAGSVAPLLLRGAMTLQAIIQLDDSAAAAPSFNTCIASLGGPGETAANNFLWGLSAQTTATAYTPVNLAAFWETGAGTDISYATTGPRSLAPIHNIIYVAMTRNGTTGNVQFYVNGKAFNAPSGAKTLPAGGDGSTAKLQLGTDTSAGTSTDDIVILSLKVNDTEFNAADILAEYNRTMGPAFGVLT